MYKDIVLQFLQKAGRNYFLKGNKIEAETKLFL